MVWAGWWTGRGGRSRVRTRPRPRWRRWFASCGGSIRGGVHAGWSTSSSRNGVVPVPSRMSVYRVLVRHGLIEPKSRRRHRRDYRRWERDEPMALWQMDIVGGVFLVDGREAKVVTGVDDHSRFCVIAAVVPRATGRAVCLAFAEAMRRWGVPEEVLTDNGKQFTDRFGKGGEVLFDRICRDNGITHRLTQPASPTTTGKVERFHQTLRRELLDDHAAVRLGPGRAGRDGHLGHRHTTATARTSPWTSTYPADRFTPSQTERQADRGAVAAAPAADVRGRLTARGADPTESSERDPARRSIGAGRWSSTGSCRPAGTSASPESSSGWAPSGPGSP